MVEVVALEPCVVERERKEMIHSNDVVRFDLRIVGLQELIPCRKTRFGGSCIKETQFIIMPITHRLVVLFGIGFACAAFGYDMTVTAHPIEEESEHFGDIICCTDSTHFRIERLPRTTDIVAIDVQFGLRWIIVFPYLCYFVCCQSQDIFLTIILFLCISKT